MATVGQVKISPNFGPVFKTPSLGHGWLGFAAFPGQRMVWSPPLKFPAPTNMQGNIFVLASKTPRRLEATSNPLQLHPKTARARRRLAEHPFFSRTAWHGAASPLCFPSARSSAHTARRPLVRGRRRALACPRAGLRCERDAAAANHPAPAGEATASRAGRRHGKCGDRGGSRGKRAAGAGRRWKLTLRPCPHGPCRRRAKRGGKTQKGAPKPRSSKAILCEKGQQRLGPAGTKRLGVSDEGILRTDAGSE